MRHMSHIALILLITCLTSSAWATTPHADIWERFGPGAGVLPPYTFANACNSFSGGYSEPTSASQLTSCTPGPATRCMHRVTIPDSEFPNAQCNDGSEGVFYVRPGVGDDADKWIVHLQGGSSCDGFQSCSDRWCGMQGVYKANKMSSDWDGDGTIDLPLTASAEGIFNVDGTLPNNFEDWTHVWVYYCSSDNWLGRKNNVTYFDIGHGASISLNFRGHTILRAARKILRGLSTVGTSDTGYGLPNIDTATHVVFSGTSAGAAGAIQNADWFFSALPATQSHYLVLDAGMDITKQQNVDHDLWVEDVAAGTYQKYGAWRKGLELDKWATLGYYDRINAFVDESCRAVYEPLGQMHKCSTPGLLLATHINEIQTSTFLRFDMTDLVILGIWDEMEMRIGNGGSFPTPQEYLTTQYSGLEDLYNTGALSGVFSPRCASLTNAAHVGLERDVAFLEEEVQDVQAGVPIGSFYTFDAALTSWLNIDSDPLTIDTPAPIRVIDSDVLGSPVSVCP